MLVPRVQLHRVGPGEGAGRGRGLAEPLPHRCPIPGSTLCFSGLLCAWFGMRYVTFVGISPGCFLPARPILLHPHMSHAVSDTGLYPRGPGKA